MKKKKNKGRRYGPVFVLMFLTLLIIVLSPILSLIGFEGNQATINNNTIETTLVTVRNVFSWEGIRFLIGSIKTNLSTFSPLVVLIISLIGIGIGEKSGFLEAIFSKFKNWKSYHITLLTLFIGIISSFLGEDVYAFLIPLAGVFYKYAGRNARLGIFTIFIGIGAGYGTSLLGGYTDYLLGQATQLAARVEVDKTYQYDVFSNLYLMIGSVAILTLVGTIIVERLLTPKFPKKTPLLEEEKRTSKKGLLATSIASLVFLLVVSYGLLPKLPFGGFLLDLSETNYYAQALGPNAPFGQSFVFLIVLLLMMDSFIYGKISRNIKSSNDYSIGLSKSFEGTGYVFVLMFFSAQMIAILNWTNIGTVLSARLVTSLSSIQFSGIALIATFFLIVVIMSLIIPGTEEKWVLLHPIIVPLFMRSNITPDFTQFIFRAADGIGKCMTPMYGYFIILLAFLQKYNYDESYEITIFGTLRKMLPTVLFFAGLWILILLGWFVIGLPMGMGVYSAL